MSREQRTRLNVMVSEQTGAAAATKVPGRTTQSEQTEETEGHEADGHQAEGHEAEGQDTAGPDTTPAPAGGLYAQSSPLARFAKPDASKADG